MGNFRLLKPQKRETSTTSSSLAQAVRPFAPLSSVSAHNHRETSAAPTQTEQGSHLGRNFAHIPLFPKTTTFSSPKSAPPTLMNQQSPMQAGNSRPEVQLAPSLLSHPFSAQVMQRQKMAEPRERHVRLNKNTTGLPDTLKAGVEQRSGLSMDDVHVHYNSSKPARVQALAYTQGTEIHVGPGQERHLAHEMWHVVQQKQGRVKATSHMNGTPLNDEAGLEQEAEQLGKRELAANGINTNRFLNTYPATSPTISTSNQPLQRFIRFRISDEKKPKDFVLSQEHNPLTTLGPSVIFRWYLGTVLQKGKTSQAVLAALVAMRDDQTTTWTLDSTDQHEVSAFLGEIDRRIGLGEPTWKLKTYTQERAKYIDTPIEDVINEKSTPEKKKTVAKSTRTSGMESKGKKEERKEGNADKVIDEGNVLGAFVKRTKERPIEYVVKGLTGTPIRTIYVSESEKALLDQLYKNAQETMINEEYPTFGELKQKRIINNTPLAGVEIELKGLYIDLSEHPDIATAAAIAGHKPIAEKGNIEIHIDAAAGTGLALIEIVTKPLQLEPLLDTLTLIKKRIKTKETLFQWLNTFKSSKEEESKTQSPKDLLLNFILHPQTQIKYNVVPVHVQLTTSLTEREFAGPVAEHTIFKHRPTNPNYTLADVLKNTPAKTKSPKSGQALIKHAYEQLEEANEQTIPNDTRVDKVPFDYTANGKQQPAQLRTQANKISPLLTRNGERAFLVEYRGGGSTTKHFILDIKKYLENTTSDISKLQSSIEDAFPHLKVNKKKE